MSVVILLILSVQGVHSSYSVESEGDGGGQHCSPPSGSVDGGIVVEDGEGGVADITTITWQVALGSTLCYRYNQNKSCTLLGKYWEHTHNLIL